MGNRKLPFGYQMRMGEIIWNEPDGLFISFALRYAWRIAQRNCRADEQNRSRL